MLKQQFPEGELRKFVGLVEKHSADVMRAILIVFIKPYSGGRIFTKQLSFRAGFLPGLNYKAGLR